MIILDTNIISDQMTRLPDERVLAWLNRYEISELWLTSITIAELRFGAWLPNEANRHQYLMRTIDDIQTDYEGRILVFDERSAGDYAKLCAVRRKTGRPIETKDAMIASIAIQNGATLATCNIRDFDGLGLTLVNPFEG